MADDVTTKRARQLFAEGYSYEQIGRSLGLPTKRVRRMLRLERRRAAAAIEVEARGG